MIDYHGPGLYRDAITESSSLDEWWSRCRILIVTGDDPDTLAATAVCEAARAIGVAHVRLPSLVVLSEPSLPSCLDQATGYAFVQVGSCPTSPDLTRTYTRLLGTALDTGQPVVLASLLAPGTYQQRFGIPLVRRLNHHMELRNDSLSYKETLA